MSTHKFVYIIYTVPYIYIIYIIIFNHHLFLTFLTNIFLNTQMKMFKLRAP